VKRLKYPTYTTRSSLFHLRASRILSAANIGKEGTKKYPLLKTVTRMVGTINTYLIYILVTRVGMTNSTKLRNVSRKYRSPTRLTNMKTL